MTAESEKFSGNREKKTKTDEVIEVAKKVVKTVTPSGHNKSSSESASGKKIIDGKEERKKPSVSSIEQPILPKDQVIEKKTITTFKDIVGNEMKEGGVLHGIVEEMPEDVQLIEFLADTSERMKHGAKPDVILADLYKRMDAGEFRQDEALEVYKRLGPTIHGEMSEEELQQYEGTGSPRRTYKKATSREAVYTDIYDGYEPEIAKMPQQIQDRINSLKSIKTGQYAGISETDMEQAIHDMEDVRKEINKSRIPFTEEQNRIFSELKQKFYERQDQLQAVVDKSEYVENRMYLDPQIAHNLKYDLIKVKDALTEDALIQIFKGNEHSPLAKISMDRLEQVQYVLFSPTFDERRADLLVLPNGDKTDPAVIRDLMEARKNFLRLSKPQQEKLARSFEIQFKAASWLGAYKDAPALNDKRYQQYVNERMDEDDFFGLDGQYGALVGRFRRSLNKNYRKHVFDEHGQRRGMDPKWWDQAVDETIEEMRGNERNKKRFEDYRKGEFYKLRPGSQKEEATLRPVNPIPREELDAEYDHACTVIADLAKVRMIMNFEKANLDAHYAPPKWSQSQKDIASDFLAKQRELRLSHPYENHLMQWNTFGTGKTELERVNIRHRAEIWLETMPEAREFGDNHAAEIWGRVEQYKSGTLPKEQERILFGQIDALFYFQPDSLKRPPDPGSPEMSVWIKKMSKDRLQKEAQIYTGMQLSQRFDINPYFMMFESGYRRGSESKFLSDATAVMQEVIGEDKLFGVFDAGAVVGATLGYSNALTSGDVAGAKESYVNKLAPIAHSRPHELVFALRDGHSQALQENVQGTNQKREAVLVGNHEGGLLGAFDELSTNFNEIHDDLLEHKFHVQIDYFKGYENLDAVQKEVSDKWFAEKYGVQAEEKKQWYFTSMKDMSHYLLGENASPARAHQSNTGDKLRYVLFGNIGHKETPLPYKALNELANPGYIPMLSKGRWDDFPYEWMQEPERILAMMDPEGTILKDGSIARLSDRFIGAHGGDDQSGPFRRQHRDAGGAQSALDQEKKLFVPDEKIHLEGTQEKFGIISGYQGVDSATLSTDVSTGARLRTEKVYLRYGPFLENMQGACEMSQYGFPDFKAKSADELNLSLMKDRSATFGVVKNALGATRIVENVSSFVGVSNWDKIFKTIGYIPVLGQLTRGLEAVLGPKRWNMLKVSMNSKIPVGVIFQKIILTLPYVGLLLGVYSAKEASSGGEKGKG